MTTKTAAREVDPNPGDLDTSPGPIDLPTRTILHEIAEAVEAYPATEVRLEITDLEFPEDALNTGEQGTFRVKVTNNGTLTMKDVTLKAVARNGTEVKNNSVIAEFDTEAISSTTIEKIVGGGGSNVGPVFHFEAPNNTKPEGTVLVEVTVDSWNATWDFTLNKHSEASATPVATFASEVVGS